MKTTVGTQNAATRDKWLIQKINELPTGIRLLDAGCGEQRLKKYCDHLTYVAMDFAEYDGKGDGSGLQTGSFDQSNLDIVADITDVPEPDDSFDAILCVEVIEHVHNPVKALEELARLLKPGGTLIITAPFASLTHFAPHHYATGFNKYFYKYHFDRLGIHITEMQANGNFFEFVAQEIRRIPFCEEKYSKKITGLFYRIISSIMLSYLSKLSERDEGSEEFLNFGWHVKAEKK
ncbi:MAG: class I SAM-dependent methyltransferase [Bacteroidota bacterium]